MELRFGNKDPGAVIPWVLNRNRTVTLNGKTSSNKKFTTGLDSNISHWSLEGGYNVKGGPETMPKGGHCVIVKKYS